MDEFSIAALRSEPVDAFGVGTSVVTGSGAPTAGLVYKLVEVDGVPVAKRSRGKASVGGAKAAVRVTRASGTAVEEISYPIDSSAPDTGNLRAVQLTIPLMRDGNTVEGLNTLEQSRNHLASSWSHCLGKALRSPGTNRLSPSGMFHSCEQTTPIPPHTPPIPPHTPAEN